MRCDFYSNMNVDDQEFALNYNFRIDISHFHEFYIPFGDFFSEKDLENLYFLDFPVDDFFIKAEVAAPKSMIFFHTLTGALSDPIAIKINLYQCDKDEHRFAYIAPGKVAKNNNLYIDEDKHVERFRFEKEKWKMKFSGETVCYLENILHEHITAE